MLLVHCPVDMAVVLTARLVIIHAVMKWIERQSSLRYTDWRFINGDDLAQGHLKELVCSPRTTARCLVRADFAACGRNFAKRKNFRPDLSKGADSSGTCFSANLVAQQNCPRRSIISPASWRSALTIARAALARGKPRHLVIGARPRSGRSGGS